MRIGLVSDTHDDLCDWPAVCARVSEALSGVDLVVVCGDLSTLAVLDDLEAAVAPVRATRSTDDPPPIPGRLATDPSSSARTAPHRRHVLGARSARRHRLGAVLRATSRSGRVRRHACAGDRGRWWCAAREPGSPSLAAELTVGSSSSVTARARIIDVPA
jgi:hypothetical protein